MLLEPREVHLSGQKLEINPPTSPLLTMRFAALLALSLLAVTLAGCSDDPPAGDIASSGAAYGIDGHVHSSTFQQFNDPTPQGPSPANVVPSCMADGAPAELDPVIGQYRCTQAFSELNYLFVSLPQASWTMAFSDSTGTNPDAGAKALTDNGDGSYAWNHTEEGQYIMDTHDQVTLYAGTTAVATSGLNDGDSLEIVPALQGISYSANYSGKSLTGTVTGISEEEPVAVTGWLVTVDDAGVKTHEEQVDLSGNGEFTHDAGMNIADFDEFHIHLAGTSINLATGTIA